MIITIVIRSRKKRTMIEKEEKKNEKNGEKKGEKNGEKNNEKNSDKSAKNNKVIISEQGPGKKKHEED